jgi:hypothetical protein
MGITQIYMPQEMKFGRAGVGIHACPAQKWDRKQRLQRFEPTIVGARDNQTPTHEIDKFIAEQNDDAEHREESPL